MLEQLHESHAEKALSPFDKAAGEQEGKVALKEYLKKQLDELFIEINSSNEVCHHMKIR